MKKSATFSPDRIYRYSLTRDWSDPSLIEDPKAKPGSVVFCCLNPSTADENIDDPTIRKCIGFSKLWGYSAFTIVNLFAFRATDPKDMKKERDPIGPENDDMLLRHAEKAALFVCAWGVDGGYLDRCYDVQRSLGRKFEIPLFRLGTLTKDGFPRHPLYLSYSTNLNLQ